MGESACAVLLENSEDNISDFIDSSSYIDSSLSCYIKFPPDGFSKVLPIDEDTPKDNRIIEWMNFNTDVTSPFMALANSVSNGKIKPGDYVILWRVGAGVVASCILLRY